jgi:hypothetical protein
MRNATCARTESSKLPTQVAPLYGFLFYAPVAVCYTKLTKKYINKWGSTSGSTFMFTKQLQVYFRFALIGYYQLTCDVLIEGRHAIIIRILAGSLSLREPVHSLMDITYE